MKNFNRGGFFFFFFIFCLSKIIALFLVLFLAFYFWSYGVEFFFKQICSALHLVAEKMEEKEKKKC